MDAPIACLFDGIVHLLGPILVMTNGDERFAVEQPSTVLMRVEIGRVADIVTGPLQPTDKVVLIPEEMATAIVRRVGSVKGHLHRAWCARDSIWSAAVVLVH